MSAPTFRIVTQDLDIEHFYRAALCIHILYTSLAHWERPHGITPVDLLRKVSYHSAALPSLSNL